MSKNKVKDHNATPLDDGTGLHGGTEHVGIVLPESEANPSTATSGSPAGTSGRTPANPDGSTATAATHHHPSRASRHVSESEVARAARAAVDAPTHSGFNENDPANEQRVNSSDGTHASTSGRKLAEPHEVAQADG